MWPRVTFSQTSLQVKFVYWTKIFNSTMFAIIKFTFLIFTTEFYSPLQSLSFVPCMFVHILLRERSVSKSGLPFAIWNFLKDISSYSPFLSLSTTWDLICDAVHASNCFKPSTYWNLLPLFSSWTISGKCQISNKMPNIDKTTNIKP